MIPFNKPYLTGKEAHYMYDAVNTGKLSGNGKYTKKCQEYFEEKYGFRKTLLTTSCTDALEMCALLLDIKPGDEVIIPSYTFVSTALAFVRQGAKVIFADSEQNNPNLDVRKLESLITTKTKAIVPVHYAGVSVDMEPLMDLAEKYNLFIVEDAAQAIDSYYKGKPLGTIGHLSAFSFHETKNIISGEGGLLGINDKRFVERAETIWEKGTNRASFFRGEVNKYGWVDIGSSFLPSETTAAFLFAQLENLDDIQRKRISIWNSYSEKLKPLQGKISFPTIPSYATCNAHMFYLVCNSLNERDELIKTLKENNIHSVFHYLSLHKSPYYLKNFNERPKLIQSDRYTDTLLRLPLFYELKESEINHISKTILKFYSND
ncbi:dTDP-4-amino-4,6-dideoxygalactose transaminase [Polaribacter aestuariivivens]|uniref:dTDP-4-amino-4,6-dideoxygalactose transaminase n=1 Tax=Polaribacter aestuariivivens TaxID=2304626 RepID=UPI003F492C57